MQKQKNEAKQLAVEAVLPSITPVDLSLTVRLYITQESYRVIKEKTQAKNTVVDFNKAVQASKKNSSLFTLNYAYLCALVPEILSDVVFTDLVTDVFGYGGSGFSSEPKAKYMGLSLRRFIKEDLQERHDAYLKKYLLSLVLLSLVKPKRPASFKGISFNIYDDSRKVIMKEPLTGLDVPSKLTLNVVDAPFTENFHHLHGYYMACCVASISSMLNEAKLKIKLAKIKENVSEKTHTIRGELSKIVLVKSLLEEMLLARHTPSTQSLPLVRSIDLLGRVLEGVNESLPKGSDFVLTPEQKVRKLALKNVNLVTFVNETFEACCLAQGRVSSKSVPIIKFTLKSKLPVTWSGWVHLNRSYVEDVLYNLISNAVKYAKTAIFVSLETQSLNQELKVLVRDDGIGIRDEKLKDVFKGGAMQLASKQVSGAHVGLSHCKRSADKLGDTLLVRNQGVSGAEFEFVTRCSPSIRLKKRVSAKPVVLLEKKCILVEDNAINMAVLLRMVKLHVSSAYIRTFRSATLALSHILQHPDVSFIISDQELGDELKGSAFIKMLRVFYESNPKWSLPKCAIATGYTELGQGEDVHLISKPVTKNKISTFFRSERPGIVQVEQRVPVTASSPGV